MATLLGTERMRVKTIERYIREYEDIVQRLGDAVENTKATRLREMVEQGKKAAVVFRAISLSGELRRAVKAEIEKAQDEVGEAIASEGVSV